MTSERRQLLQSIAAANELLRRKAKEDYKRFVLYMKDDYIMKSFHAYICERLQAFAEGKVKKMMILVPAQHGKSELATRLFPAYLLGLNPELRIAIATYGYTLAKKFNRDIQRNMSTAKYSSIFPDTRIGNNNKDADDENTYTKTQSQFDIVGHQGSLITLGRGGGLTGNPVDIGIMDDLYKDRNEAISPTISEGIWDWYVDVFLTRLHNNSQQLIMNTRWDENDLAGRLLTKEPNEWEVIVFPAIKTQDVVPYDNREEGEPLFPEKHSLEKLLKQKGLDETSFNSIYQQDPKPNTQILIYNNWIEIPEWPKNIETYNFGLDWGGETGITTLIKCAMDEENAWFDEWFYEKDMSTKNIIDLLKDQEYGGQIIHADHSPTKINALILGGITVMPAIKGEGSVHWGITELKKKKCHYTARSVNLKSELRKYQWFVYGQIITNIPVKKDNHALDACRYGTVSQFFIGV